MLTTIGTVVLTVAVLRIVEVWIQSVDNRNRTWREEDKIPDAVD